MKMLYDTNNINLTLLKQYRNSFFNEKSNFINRSYSNFLSSHLNSCNDTYIKLMISRLDKLYKNIDDSYSSILKWLDDYIENVNALESFLRGDSSSSFISESTIRNFANSKLNNLTKNNISNIKDNIDFIKYVV